MPIARALTGGWLAAALALGAPATAGSKGVLALEGAARGGVTAPSSPYRYWAVSPGRADHVTVVLRNRTGAGGRLDRWWYLPGSWYLPAVAYDGTGGGLSGDGGTLLLWRDTAAYPPLLTRIAVLNTRARLRHPRIPGHTPPNHAIRRIAIPGDLRLIGVSPHGTTAYLRQYRKPCCGRGPANVRFDVRAIDLDSGRLRPGAIAASNAPREALRGVPISQAASADGVLYTLYDGGGDGVPFVHVLDTRSGRAFRLDLPGLESQVLHETGHAHGLFRLRLWLRHDARELDLIADARRLLRIHTKHLHGGGGAPVATTDRGGGEGWLAFTRTPRRPGNLVARAGTIGSSAAGRPIHLRQTGDPAIDGHLLVFGCIHGDECGIARRVEALRNGCPDPAVDSFVVPDLDPDGTATGTRLNAHGVDLNRNFPAGWRPGGEPRGDPEYPGPRPFSEPETRLAARLIRALDPEVTIWFHEDPARRPVVRAWGPSEPAARRFAALAGMPFRAIPWPAGTAPNWQNHAFPGTASFVVELPRGRAGKKVTEARLDRAVDTIAREVAKD